MSEEVLKQNNNVILIRATRLINGTRVNDLYVKVVNPKKRKIRGFSYEEHKDIWHFPDTELGMRLALEKYEHAIKNDFKPFKSKYSDEIETLAEKYWKLNK